MAVTADSTEPWPVMMATSVRGSAVFTCRSRSIPDICGSFKSAMTMSGASASSRWSAASPLSASVQ